jgi:hypothetical protein
MNNGVAPELPTEPSLGPPQRPRQRLWPVEAIARYSASALLLIYGFGFVILSFNDAKYGVVEFSPFRARILVVGFVFALLVGLAAWAQHAQLLYWNLLKKVRADNDRERYWRRDFVVGCGFVFPASYMGYLFGIYMFASAKWELPSHKWIRIALLLVVAFLSNALFNYVDNIFAKKPRPASLIAFGAAILYVAGIDYLLPDIPLAGLIAFLAYVGYISAGARRKGILKFFAHFLSWILIFAATWIYISEVFYALPPRWGGGQLTPVQVFETTQPAWSPSNPVDALLLDETEQGLYVLLSPHGKAFFLPRADVESIFFGSKDELPKRSPR